jgi:hypothetical protein
MGGLLAPRPLPITSYGNGGGASSSALNNCVLIGNQAAGAGGGAFDCTLTNCVLLSNNTAAAWSSVLYNSISYYNAGGNEAGCAMTNCCTTPDPGGSGNITNEPVFVDLTHGNLRLQSNSPCINAGNNAYIASATDLDGNPRVINGSVDIGAYEYQGPSGLAGFHVWLSQFGLPSDGSADYADSDGDGMNNYEEWRAGTNPTNSASVLKVLAPQPGSTNVVLSWQSALGIGYLIQRATAMGSSPAFVTLATNLAGLGGLMTFYDTNSIAGSQRFYRIGVGN